VKINDLVDRYKVDQSTVTQHVKRAGVQLRLPALLAEEVDEAMQLYQAGQSLRKLGLHFGVRDTTVRSALLRAGVKMRDCQGRETIEKLIPIRTSSPLKK
jgi:hypothetical protein